MEASSLRERIHQLAGGPVVVVFRKGPRFKEERRCDSESDSFEDLEAILSVLLLYFHDAPPSRERIGKEIRGNYLPWESEELERMIAEGPTEEDHIAYGSPIVVQDVEKNEQTGITTIYMQ